MNGFDVSVWAGRYVRIAHGNSPANGPGDVTVEVSDAKLLPAITRPAEKLHVVISSTGARRAGNAAVFLDALEVEADLTVP